MNNESTSGKSADQDTSYEEGQRPLQAPRNHSDPSETKHQRYERRYWKINTVTSIITCFALIITLSASIYSAIIATRTLDATSPPKLVVTQIHIWNSGRGRPEDPLDHFPTLIAGNKIDGAAFIRNNGGHRAIVTDSDLVVQWRTSNPDMFNPGWGNPGNNRLYPYAERSDDLTIDRTAVDKENIIDPGHPERWAFTTVVPKEARGFRLFLFGHVAYKDELNREHGTFFVRVYNADKHIFEIPPDVGDNENSY